MNLFSQIEDARNEIQARCSLEPEFGIILGTGLGGFAANVNTAASVPYSEIPHFPEPEVLSHSGRLLLGHVAGKVVAVLDGRCHYYEGYSLNEITLGVRVLKALGVRKLIVSAACGGLNPHFDKGDLLIIDDHINLMGVNPLVGRNDDRLGPRFPDMCRPYDPEAIRLAEKLTLEAGIRAFRGVYVALTGPCLETRAEYRMLRMMGADVVGMSTVPEVIVAVHSGLKVFGIACITDLCLPDALQPADIDEIIAVANRSDPLIARIVGQMIASWA